MRVTSAVYIKGQRIEPGEYVDCEDTVAADLLASHKAECGNAETALRFKREKSRDWAELKMAAPVGTTWMRHR